MDVKVNTMYGCKMLAV